MIGRPSSFTEVRTTDGKSTRYASADKRRYLRSALDHPGRLRFGARPTGGSSGSVKVWEIDESPFVGVADPASAANDQLRAPAPTLVVPSVVQARDRQCAAGCAFRGRVPDAGGRNDSKLPTGRS